MALPIGPGKWPRRSSQPRPRQGSSSAAATTAKDTTAQSRRQARHTAKDEPGKLASPPIPQPLYLPDNPSQPELGEPHPTPNRAQHPPPLHSPLKPNKPARPSDAPWARHRILMSTRAKPTAAAPPSSLRADNTRNPHHHHHHINNNYAYSTSSSRPTINNPVPFPDHVPSSITSSNTSKPSSAGGGGGSVERERDRDRGERGGGDRGAGARPPPTGPVRSTLLQPRVAVALGVAKQWYPILFLCRLLSIVPGVVFGLPSALRLLAAVHLLYLDRVLDGGALLLVLQRRLGTAGTGGGGGGGGAGLGGVDAGNGILSGSSGAGAGPAGSSGFDAAFEARLRLTEALLATIWCCASGYLSFFFTDCLMSRWLLRYTPQATIVRLLTVDAMNGYLTSWVLHLMGGFEDPRLVLPAWIVISTTLTVLYHITQRKINIRKETSMSISVFSIASFVSMVALLAQLHSNRSDYPDIPLLNFIRWASHFAGRLVIRLMEYGDITRDL